MDGVPALVDQRYVVAPLAVSVVEIPVQVVAAGAFTTGFGLTTTFVEALLVQAGDVRLTVTV